MNRTRRVLRFCVTGMLVCSGLYSQSLPDIDDWKPSYREGSTLHPSSGTASSQVELVSQERSEATDPNRIRLIVYPKGEQPLYGYFVRFSGDSLMFWTSGTVRVFGPSDLSGVSVRRLGSSSVGLELLPIGMYAGLFVAQRIFEGDASYSDQPGFYARKFEDNEWGYIFYIALGGSVIAGLGSLIGERDHETLFIFDGSDERATDQWNELRAALEGLEDSPRFTLAIQGGYVWTRNSGIEPGQWSELYGFPTNFAVLRSLRLSYAVNNWADVGGALVFFGEPTTVSSPYYSMPFYSSSSSTYFERLSATGYFLEGTVRPFSGSLPHWLRWKVALGMGIASVEYTAETRDLSNSTIESADYKDTSFGLSLSTAVEFSLSRLVSLGVIADYVGVPGKSRISLDEFGIPSKPVGNASLGFLLVYHF